MQNIVGHFLVLALIGVPGPFNKDQAVFGSGRNVVIQIAQKLGRVSVSEIIIGAHEQSAGVRNQLGLGEIALALPLASSS